MARQEFDKNPIEQMIVDKGRVNIFEPNTLTTKLLPKMFATEEGYEVIRLGPIPLCLNYENGEPIQAGMVVYDPARYEGLLIDDSDIVRYWQSREVGRLREEGWYVVSSSLDRIVALRELRDSSKHS